MNIIIVTDTLNLGNGGVGTCVYDLCEAFLKRCNRVLLVGIVSYSNTDDSMLSSLKRMGVELLNIGAKTRKEALMLFPFYVQKLRSYIFNWSRGEKAVCNVHLKMGVLYGAVASLGLSNIRCVETYHNTYHYYHLQCWALSPIIKKYICVSKAAEDEMYKRYKIPTGKAVAVPNGVDRIKIISGVTPIEHNYKSCLVLSVGRLSSEKNLLTPIRAYKEMSGYNFKYLVIGDGPEREKAYDIAKDSDTVRLLGQVSRETVVQYLSQADIVVMPSLWEGRSIFMLEAAAFDLPFILSDVPGLREPFDDKPLDENELYRRTEYGYLVKTSNIEAYRQALAHFIDFPEYHSSMKKCVKEMSINNDINKVAEKYLSIFSQVIKEIL